MRYGSGHENEILDEVYDLLDYSTRYLNKVLTNCIFHNDKRPSLLIYPDTYRCLACGEWGKTTNLIKQLQSSFASGSVIRTKPDFRNPFTRWLRKSSLNTVLKRSNRILREYSSQMSYLKNRKMPPKIILDLGIGYLDGWYTFPIMGYGNKNNKKLVGAVARIGESSGSKNGNGNSKYAIPKDQSMDLLYIPSLSQINAATSVFLTFGVIDAISLHTLGVGAISTLSGKRCNPDTLKDIRKPIYVWPDNGEEKEASILVSKLGWRGRLVKCNYPIDTKDCNDLLIKYPEKLKEIIDEIQTT